MLISLACQTNLQLTVCPDGFKENEKLQIRGLYIVKEHASWVQNKFYLKS